ncbi:hypothetical protein [Spirillospora sp. CA-294931]|uniref:hypothetical protein n=1 Tax=Spirillospora sp. CA-294931 TaxID=3240042 RepID=UPI003D89FA6C
MTRSQSGCVHFIGAQARTCGAVPTQLYIQGPRCAAHTPSKIAGVLEPPPGACAPLRCYCGRPSCPAFDTYEPVDRYAADEGAASAPNDARAIASDERRASHLDQAATRDTDQARRVAVPSPARDDTDPPNATPG